jgi:transcriptional regulator with XRE-family HTH domain
VLDCRKLDELRRKRGETQRDFGELLGGVSQATYSSWIRGARQPLYPHMLVYAFADALGVDPRNIGRKVPVDERPKVAA